VQPRNRLVHLVDNVQSAVDTLLDSALGKGDGGSRPARSRRASDSDGGRGRARSEAGPVSGEPLLASPVAGDGGGGGGGLRKTLSAVKLSAVAEAAARDSNGSGSEATERGELDSAVDIAPLPVAPPGRRASASGRVRMRSGGSGRRDAGHRSLSAPVAPKASLLAAAEAEDYETLASRTEWI
jgi:hypothetical protein